MELLKIVMLSIVICFMIVVLKQIKPEFSMLVLIVGSIILLIYIINSLSKIYGFVKYVLL
jgi:hypothetical protein